MKLLNRKQRMMTKKTKTRNSQYDKFVAAAKATGADEDETTFDAKLAGIAKGKPLPMDQVKEIVAKRKREKKALNGK